MNNTADDTHASLKKLDHMFQALGQPNRDILPHFCYIFDLACNVLGLT